MEIRHIELKEANAFVNRHHRHHKPVTGHRFSLSCVENGQLVGVAIVGRPVARNINQYNIVEVLRLCTDGSKNACSILYAACRRAFRELGCQKIITYIQATESGISLKAAGWDYEYTTRGGSRSTPSRPRYTHAPTGQKQLYSSLFYQ